MNTATSSDLVRENFNALHKEKENFVKSESSDKVRRALRYNVCTYSEVNFQPGDRVYYKRRKDKEWKGPAKVLGKETNFILIRHGSAYFRCYPCQLMKLNDAESGTQQVKESDRDNKNDAESGTQQVKESDRDNKNDAESGTQQVKESDKDNKKVISSQKDKSSSDEDTPEEKGSQNLSSNAEEKKSQALSSSVDDGREVCPVNYKNKEEKQINNEFDHDETGTSSDTAENQAENEREQYGVEHLKHSDTKPKISTVVQYCLNDGSITRAKVIFTQPKRSGKYKN